MKTVNLLLIYLTLIALIVSPGCNNNVSNQEKIVDQNNSKNAVNGQLLLNLSYSRTRTMLPDIDMEPTSYIVKGNGPNGSSFEVTTDQKSVEIVELTFGEWEIMVEALNKDLVPIGGGEGTTIIHTNEISTLLIEIIPLNGNGNLELELSWDENLVINPSVEAQLTGKSGNPVDLNFNILGNLATSNSSIAAGYYLLNIRMYDNIGDIHPYYGGGVEVVRIVQNQTTNGTIYISGNLNYGYGDTQIDITTNMNDPIEVLLNGQTDYLLTGESMSVQASAPGETVNIEYTWFLNGEQIGTGNSLSFGSNLPEGLYRLDCTAFTEDKERGGVFTHNFYVTSTSTPLSPSNFSATPVSSSQIDLTWADNSNNEDGFRIERALDSGFIIGVITFDVAQDITSFIDTGLASDTDYYYRVKAFNSIGDSEYSNEVSAITFDVAPTAPSVLTATSVSSSQIDLLWTDNSNNEDGFRIERALDIGFTVGFVMIEVGQDITSYVDTGLSANTLYYYRISAYNGIDDSGYSQTNATTDINPPSIVTVELLSATSLRIVFSEALDLITAEDTNNYNINEGISINNALLESDGFTVTLSTSAHTILKIFTLTVINIKDLNNNAISEEITFNYKNETDLILQMHFDGNVSDSSINNLDGYWVGEPNYIDGKLNQGLNMQNNIDNYVIIEHDDRLAGMEQVTISIWAKKTTPDGGGLLFLKHVHYRIIINGDRLTAYLGNEFEIVYIYVANVGLFNDTEWHHYILRYNGEKVEVFVDATLIAEENINGPIQNDNTRDIYIGKDPWGNTFDGQIDEFRIYNHALNQEDISALFNEGTLIEMEIPPSMPTNLSATSTTSNQIELSWIDNSNNEIGFRIDRSEDLNFIIDVSTNYISSNLESYSDINLTANTTYYYRLMAYNSAGNSEYSNITNATTSIPTVINQIIADHTVVDKYDQIPAEWIAEVRKMWFNVPGESHSLGYRKGTELLEVLNNQFQVNLTESGTPEGYTDQYLRISRASWGDINNATGWRYGYGEEDFFTSTAAVERTKAHLTYANTNSFEISAFAFGWCWDMTWHNSPGGVTDSVHNVRWAGSSVGGPEGDLIWGLDDGDSALTGNSVSMQTYLQAVEAYITHSQNNSYGTNIIFTTGPVDGGGNTGENGYQRYLKHEYIRNYVKEDTTRILFDYTDILTYNDSGEQNLISWDTHSFPFIHDDNMMDFGRNGSEIQFDVLLAHTEDGDHIGEKGALRLGKAIWWMLARIAGWDGN